MSEFFVFWKTKHFILALFFFFLHLLFFCLIRELDKSSQHDSRTAISSWLLLVEGIRFFNYRSSSICVSLKLLHGHMMGISRNLWSRLVVWRLHSFWSTDHTNTPTKKTLPPHQLSSARSVWCNTVTFKKSSSSKSRFVYVIYVSVIKDHI